MCESENQYSEWVLALIKTIEISDGKRKLLTAPNLKEFWRID